MKKKIFMSGLIIFMFLMISVSVFAGENGEDNQKENWRQIQFLMDRSDMTYLINGGREAFDLALRQCAPEWLVYDISAQNRDVIVTLKFDFLSWDEYREKTEQLLTYLPGIIVFEEDGILMENFAARELLNFVWAENESVLGSAEVIDRFAMVQNQVCLSGNVFDCGEWVNIYPEDTQNPRFSHLEVYTSGNDDGSFERKITGRIDTEVYTDEQIDVVFERFKQSGSATANNFEQMTEISVTIEAIHQNDLIEKTMLCLAVPYSVTEQQQPVNPVTAGVLRTEFFALEQCMAEGGTFKFSYEPPSYYENLTSDEAHTSVSDTVISSSDHSMITYSFERGIKFDKVTVETDLSHYFGKKKRTISLALSSDIAGFYHERIKAQLGQKLIPGAVLHIYDTSAYRYYDIEYSSWLFSRLAAFTEAILPDAYNMTVHENWWLLSKQEIKEVWALDDIISDMAPADENRISYIIPEKTARFDKETKGFFSENIAGQKLELQTGISKTISLSYTRFRIAIGCACILLLIFIIILVFKIKRALSLRMQKLKGRKKKGRKQKESKQQKSHVYCPECGNIILAGQTFCGKCGKNLAD